jgi:hypothetical protein
MPRTGRPKVERLVVKCQGCHKRMEVTHRDWEKGRGRYCGRECYHRERVGSIRGPYGDNKNPQERACVVCGNAFFVSGYATANRRQRMCSVECQRASRYRRGAKANELIPLNAAYIAGLVDGEGSIMLYTRRDAVALRLTLTNTHKRALEWVAEKVGVGVVLRQRIATATHAESFGWQCNAEAAETVLNQLRPYLIIKSDQAEMAVAFQERLRDPALKADRSWQLEWRAKMKALNRRGRRPATPLR